MTSGKPPQHVPVWVRLGHALRPTGLPFAVLPLGQRYPVHIQVDGFLLIGCANDTPPSKAPPPTLD